jgi:hypothetical protein
MEKTAVAEKEKTIKNQTDKSFSSCTKIFIT